MPLISEERRFELPPDELVARGPAALAAAFGGKVSIAEDGAWRLATTRGGVTHDVVIRVAPAPSGARVALEVDARRTAGGYTGRAAMTIVATAAWVVAGALTFGDFQGTAHPGRVAMWIGSLLLAALLTGLLVRGARLNAVRALEPVEQLWRALEALEAAPRIGRGYRVAPALRVAADDDAAEAEAAAAEESTLAGCELASAPGLHGKARHLT